MGISSAAGQRTLGRAVSGRGIGLHGGQPVHVRLIPAEADAGIAFRRIDLDEPRDLLARAAAVGGTDHATTLADTSDAAASVQTVEHLLAALAGMGIDNCLVELDAPEIPILDGSAAPWVRLIQQAGTTVLDSPRRSIRVLRAFELERGGARISVAPASALRVTSSIEFAHPAIGRQEVSLAVTPRAFARELAPARTFGFLREVEALRRAGLARGGSLENAIVLDDTRVVSGPLRFTDEFARHKALDLIGDLALLGLPLKGHVRAHRAGHALNVEFAKALIEQTSCWRIETEARPVAGVLEGLPVLAGHGVSALREVADPA